MLVVGMDPGQKSGLVLASAHDRAVDKILEWHEYDQRTTTHWLWEVLPTADVLVCERWVSRGGPIAFKPYSLELIGLARGLCWHLSVPLVLQAAVMKNTFHAEALERFPEVGRGGGGHARDALAHVLGWTKTRAGT